MVGSSRLATDSGNTVGRVKKVAYVIWGTESRADVQRKQLSERHRFPMHCRNAAQGRRNVQE